ncbi:CvpA family protein [Oscillochloris sp. ZM17-4]|uniref:CvpA family protein n=1 Tax=Oscillochloris sp. ZM17-4 TaxID=2866714 RepID=UPI001C731B22|nr:CvpA family protein [Oscillochloris sp. ZM17-4]MBX0327307.1 CvpA family protein [Oscillochloris sp. ZM17-4]
MVLTILSVAALGVLGLFGLFRGVRRGLIAVAGTLLGAVLIDLWQARWSDWLSTQMEPPGWVTFLVTAAIFLLVALLVGYGGSLLLPRDPKAKGPGLFDRLLGACIGALNGALIVSYLLRYANENWPSGEAERMIAGSLVAGVLDLWLPWFILAMVGSTTVFVMLRGTLRVSRALSRPATTATPSATTTKPAIATSASASAAAKGQAATQPSATPPPKTVAEQDRRVLDKIDQVGANKK